MNSDTIGAAATGGSASSRSPRRAGTVERLPGCAPRADRATWTNELAAWWAKPASDALAPRSWTSGPGHRLRDLRNFLRDRDLARPHLRSSPPKPRPDGLSWTELWGLAPDHRAPRTDDRRQFALLDPGQRRRYRHPARHAHRVFGNILLGIGLLRGAFRRGSPPG